MSYFDLIYRYFPDRELAIRRRLKTDDVLRAICTDYCEAQRALSHWEAAGPKGSGMVAQYRTLVDELSVELGAQLRPSAHDSHETSKPGRGEVLAHWRPRAQREPQR